MIILKKRTIIILTVLIASLFTFCISVYSLCLKPANKVTANKIKIVIDAGHGGVDGGVSGINTKVKESDLNLKVSKKLEKYFISAGMNVVLTRPTTAGLYGIAKTNLKRKDMEKRKEIILDAKPDMIISVHMNKYSYKNRRGAQVFYKIDDINSKILAESIQRNFNEMKDNRRQCSALKGDYYILNCSPYPSVICECGFLSNPDDEALLITEEYQDCIAYTIFKGAVEYLVKAE